MKAVTYLASLVQLCCGEGGTLQTNITVCVGSAYSVCTILGLPQSKETRASQIYTAQAPGCSARALSQVGPVLRTLPRSKLVQVLGYSARAQARLGACFVPFPGLSSLGDQVLGEYTVPGVWCILSPPWSWPLAFLVYTAQAPGCSAGAPSKVGLGLCALCRSKLLRFRFSGTPQWHRLGWACVLCPSQV